MKKSKLKQIIKEEIQKVFEDQRIVDKILDKISISGVESLTPNEKEYLDKYSKGEKNLLEPTSGETNLYVSEQDNERFKIENFPALPNVGNIEFECEEEDEEGFESCKQNEDYKKLLQVKDFKNILEKIIKYYKNPEMNLYNAFHGFTFYGNFSQPQPLVYLYFSGDGYLYIMDNEEFGKEDEEHFGLKTWKEL